MAELANENFEFVKKFSYRDYKGQRTSRLNRIFSLATFEMTSTWNKSTIGKILLGFVLFLNVLTAIIAVPIISAQMNSSDVTDKTEFVHQAIFKTVAEYLAINLVNPILPSVDNLVIFTWDIGFLIIALLAIAGSGFFADDKQGKVIEIYLSRMKREDYAVGKLLGMFLYCNVFITIPFLIISIWTVQGLGQNQFDYILIYLAVGIAGAVISSIFTIFTLILSSLVEKRAYASLSFFLGYMLFDILAESFFNSDPSNQLLLLIVPSYVITLLIYTLGGNWNLGLVESFSYVGESTIPNKISPLLLNDGIGLEWWHIIGVVSVVFILGLLFLLFKIHRMTTNEL